MSKVLVAMSGGIDSSVAAALLKEQGHELIGVHLKFWHEQEACGQNKCCTLESAEKAREVADQLGIPFYVLNFKEAFKEKVVDYFLAAATHETPNPCIRCNREIKFGKLLQKMKELDCDFQATGHYARIRHDSSYHLLKGLDSEKDQSYFLYTLTQEKLQHILFPLGDFNKKQVRELAQKFKLKAYEKNPGESQDLCSYSEKTPDEFLKRHLPNIKKGSIKHLNGTLLKEQHEGLPLYTIGQRKGLKIGGLKEALYVVKLDFEHNTLIVGSDEALFKDELEIRDLTFVSGEIPKEPLTIEAKIRYRNLGTSAELSITPCNNALESYGKLRFYEKVRAVTPGQSVVFYDGDEVLGGGVIV